MTPTLRTGRLELRPCAPEHEADFVRLFSDPSVTRWMGMPSADVRTVFRRAFTDEHRVTWDSWSVYEDDAYVGHVELKPSPNAQVDGYELVYALVPAAWGRGIGAEVAATVTEYGLRTLGLSMVNATVDPENVRSLALLHKLGYEDVRELVDDEDGTSSRLLTKQAGGSTPITEHRGEWGEAVIEPSALLRRVPEMPERMVLCFFREVIDNLADAPTIKTLTWAHGGHDIRRIEVRGEPVGVLHPGVGAPLAAGLLEEAIAYGGRTFVAVGGCGALVPELALGHAIVPTAAIRDEGTSYHYLPPSRTVEIDPAVVSAARKVLERHAVPYVTGVTWTTDAPYRETPDIVGRRRDDGAIVVEMETAAFAAVARRRGVAFGQLLYAGDTLAGETWDSRAWWRAHHVRESMFRLATEIALEL